MSSVYESAGRVKIVYKHLGSIPFTGNMMGWLCPICNLFRPFATREMLDRHLAWDHAECTYEWEVIVEDEVSVKLLLI